MSSDDEWKERITEEVREHTAKRIARIVSLVVGGVFVVIFLGFLLAWVIQFLWNATLVPMFDWPSISYWQAVGVFILAKIFFGFGHSGRSPKHGKAKKTDDERVRQWWRRRMGATTNGQPPVASDETFRQYWQEEGRAAYEAYVAARKGSASEGPGT